MMLRAEAIASRLELANKDDQDDPLIITPMPDLKKLPDYGSASLDMRLGCWFTALRKTAIPVLFARPKAEIEKNLRIADERYVRFGDSYFLHPRSFVLAVTLEWIRLPINLAGYIHGKSSWGRRGLIIATASVIHPGFVGCITLELTNLGEAPIEIKPGMRIAQLCLHKTETASVHKIDQSTFSGQRKPGIGAVKSDPIADKLMEEQRIYDEIDE
jgi:dCTP deaminase